MGGVKLRLPAAAKQLLFFCSFVQAHRISRLSWMVLAASLSSFVVQASFFSGAVIIIHDLSTLTPNAPLDRSRKQGWWKSGEHSAGQYTRKWVALHCSAQYLQARGNDGRVVISVAYVSLKCHCLQLWIQVHLVQGHLQIFCHDQQMSHRETTGGSHLCSHQCSAGWAFSWAARQERKVLDGHTLLSSTWVIFHSATIGYCQPTAVGLEFGTSSSQFTASARVSLGHCPYIST